MTFLLRLLAKWPTQKMLRLAAAIGLVAIAVMAWPVLDPSPLPVVTSMSLSPVLGGLAFVIYGLSIAADLAHASALARAAARAHRAKPGGP